MSAKSRSPKNRSNRRQSNLTRLESCLRAFNAPSLWISLDIGFHDYGGHHGDEGDQQQDEQHLKLVIHDFTYDIVAPLRQRQEPNSDKPQRVFQLIHDRPFPRGGGSPYTTASRFHT